MCCSVFGHQEEHGASDATGHYIGFAAGIVLFSGRKKKMISITVSAKVSPDVAQRISRTGYSTSDVMQVGLELFLNLTADQQTTLMWNHIQRKKRTRALERYRAKRRVAGERLD